MSSDDRNTRPSQPTPADVASRPKTSVGIVGAPLIQGELTLTDGTILNVMVVIPAVSRVEGLKNPNGSPVYELHSQVVMGVKHFEKDR